MTKRLDAKRRSSASVLLFWLLCAAMVLIGYALRLVAPTANPDVLELSRSLLLPNTVGVFPEPQDPFLFVGLTLTAGLLLIGVAAASARSDRFAVEPSSVFWSILIVAAVVLTSEHAFGDRQTIKDIVLALVLAGAAYALKIRLPERFARPAMALLLLGAAALILLQRVWTEGSLLYSGPISSHYEAVTSSVIRIAGGGTCLAEVLPQYGCYGEFLAPLLKLFGSTIPVVTAIFALILIVALWAVFHFVAKLIRGPLILVGCSICLVMAAGFNPQFDNVDPVLQYFPLRFFFPALSLLVAAWVQKVATPVSAFAAGVFAGAALAWNLESGLAVALSLAVFVGLDKFTARRWRGRAELLGSGMNLASYIAGAVLFIVAFIAYLHLKAGRPVELSNFIVFHQVFAMTGFGMIPIPAFPSYWTIHAAILFGTLFLAAVAAGRGETRDPGLELAAYVATLGICLAVYYVGRSHIVVLRLVMWPSIILIFFLLDRTLRSAYGLLQRRVVDGMVLLSVAMSAVFFEASLLGIAGNMIRARSAPLQANKEILADIQFVRSRSSPGEPVAIVAVDQGVLYGQTGARAALEGPGVAELVRRVDLERLMEFLVTRGPKKLFVGTTLGNAAETNLLGTDIEIDLSVLERNYVAEVAPGGRLIYLQRR
ncbi:hypothetical protein [Bradyrhizobium sp. SEMIA]|uniref:hypothetical protein n=1 Tax=Bradyrhizobium sp. SEMIA TaxID=2597515 RepID=UPI0018A63B1D|nr:hypothetical protein [Bradyrhizobium sp. SEMIA]QOG22133.1 hypothetical protein FOM02_37400 [Bradyrhizobium sp. SEMIA]